MYMISRVPQYVIRIDVIMPIFHMRLIFYKSVECFNVLTIVIHIFTTEEL